MSERSVHISERCFGPVVLVERSVTIQERKLSGPVHLTERTVTIPERKLLGPVHIVGHAFIRPPVLLTGPAVTPGETSCLIEWTTDIDAYHRVRYREQGVYEWTITDWSSPASTSASVTLSPLLQNTTYQYAIQSCSVGDGSQAFDWFAGVNFKTLPTSIPLILSLTGFAVTKNTITANYTSSEACTCSITGKLSTFPFYASWYSNLVEHASPHSHTKTGLTPNTTYHIKVTCTTNEGAIAYLPTQTSHYVVQTANSEGAGGGLLEVAPD